MDTQAEEFKVMAESLKSKITVVQEKDTRLTRNFEALKVREEELEAKQKTFENNLALMKEVNQLQESRIKLDVGGQSFVTSIQTLISDPDSLLAVMFSGVHTMTRQEDGSYFLDRDGSHFKHILNFLRDGTMPDKKSLTENPTFTAELLAEAKYYRIAGLEAALQDIVANRETSVGREKHTRPDEGSTNPQGTHNKLPLRRLYEKGQSISSDPILDTSSEV